LHSDVTRRTNAAAIAVHRALGPGYLEAIYEEAVGLYRLDLVVEAKVVVEVKAVAAIDRVHLATMFSYLKATGLSVGLIVEGPSA